MRKGLAILLILCMVGCFGACKKETAGTAEPDELVTVYLLAERVYGEEKTVYTYNENGDRILEVDYWGQAENGRTEYEHTYNEMGYVTKTVYFYDGQKISCPYIEYAYDANGNKTSEARFTSAGEADGSYAYTYNTDGALALRIQYDSQGEEISRHALTYDGNGKLSQVDVSGGIYMEYEYDEDGRLIQESYCYDGMAYAYARYVYNSQGDLEKVSVLSETGEETVLTYTKLSLSPVRANQLAAKTGTPDVVIMK